MKKIALFVFVIATGWALLTGCKGSSSSGSSSGSSSTSEQKPASLSIAAAKTAVIVKTSSVQAYRFYDPRRYLTAFAADSATKLFKKTANAQFLEIESQNEFGENIKTTYFPTAIDRMNSNYTVVYFGPSQTADPRFDAFWLFYINNVTGKSTEFTFSGKPSIPDQYFSRFPVFISDSVGNSYYMNSVTNNNDKQIVKVTPEMKFSALTDDADSVQFFSLSDAGDIVYWSYLRSTIKGGIVPTRRTIALSKNGVKTVLDETNSDTFVYNTTWTGLDGKNYLWDDNLRVAKRVNFAEDGSVTLTNYGTAGNIINGVPYPQFCKKTQTNTHLFFGCDATTRLYDIYNPSSEPVAHKYADHNIAAVNDLTSSTNKLYAAIKTTAGQYTIAEFSEDMSTKQNLLTPGDYQVDRVQYDGTNELLFYGVRLADQVKFIGTINLTTHAVTELKTGSDADLVMMERIG